MKKLVYDNEYPIGSVPGDALSVSPELAPRGSHAIGVRTVELKGMQSVDIRAALAGKGIVSAPRAVSAEIWYPADVPEDARQISFYPDHMGMKNTGDLEEFHFLGRAVRDADPDAEGGPYPVVILSHGYPGSRYIMSNLAENLAGKGYVTLAVGHTDTMYTDWDEEISMFTAMINRTADQRSAVDSVFSLNEEGFLKGLLDTDAIGMIGYSFGGYGLLRTLGVHLNLDTARRAGPLESVLLEPEWQGEKRVKAAVLFAPFGADLFETMSFGNITVPTLWIQGENDSVVPYAPVKDMFRKSTRSDRYFLTYELHNHKACPNPAPLAAESRSYEDGARRWNDTVWDQRYVNGINAHFLTAFFGMNLKGDASLKRYFDMKQPIGKYCVYHMENGIPAPDHTAWPGFVQNGELGLEMVHCVPSQEPYASL